MFNIKDYKIRDITPDDILALHNVYLATWLATYPNQEFNITKEDIEYKYEQALSPEKLEERKNRITQIGKNQTMLLIEHNNRVVGLCNAINKEEYNELQAIYILPEYQGLGLGRAIWEEAKNIFDLQKDIVVHVASYNDKAINFYKKLGFASTGKIFFDERFKMRNGAMIPELEMIIKRQSKLC